MSSRRPVSKLAVCFGVSFGVVALFTLLPLFLFLFQNEEVITGKGDQRVFEKKKPYITQEFNIPHFCRVLRVIAQTAYLHGDAVLIQATTPLERPVYSQSYSKYAFAETIELLGGEDRYLSYFLPNSSRMSITSCGETATGVGIPFSVPIFEEYAETRQWLDDVYAGKRDPDSWSKAVAYAHFDACPLTTTFHFNTSGYPDKRWYFPLSSRYENEYDSLVITLELEFTKYLLETNSDIVGNCTATADGFCTLPAPSGDKVFVMLEHLTSSKYPYPIKIVISCDKYDQLTYVLYFLVIPICCSIGIVFIYFSLKFAKRVCGIGDSQEEEFPVTPISHRNVGESSNNHYSDFNGTQQQDTGSSDSPPDYELSSLYPSGDNRNDENQRNVELSSLDQQNNSVIAHHPSTPGETPSMPPAPSVTSNAGESPPDYDTVTVVVPPGGETDQPGDLEGQRYTFPVPSWAEESNDLPIQPPPEYDTALSMNS